LINGNEKWVGFVGGGYNGANCLGGGACDTRGKGFFVIDLIDGSVLWSYTYNNDTNMVYSMPAPPTIVDSDSDGFIDTAYMGDMGGNMWRFDFCLLSNALSPNPLKSSSCSTSNWSGGRFFAPSSTRPIYTSASVSKCSGLGGPTWVYWGTGDKTDPTASGTQEYFYAVIDECINEKCVVDAGTGNCTGPCPAVDPGTLATLTGTALWDPQSNPNGYRIQLSTSEKVLSDPAVFGGVIYFTSFTPTNTTDPCEQGGDANLYAFKCTTGGGLFSGSRSTSIGTGIPSAPVISLKPGGGAADLYVTVSGGGGTGASTSRVNMNPPGVSNRTNIIYWRDQRIQ